MKNFKASVPASVQTKLNELAKEVQHAFADIVTPCYEALGDVQVSDIEGNYVSGWMPRQDGGYDVSLLVDSGIDSSYHITEKQTEFVNEQIKNCFNSFLLDKGISEEEFNEQYDLEIGDEDFRQEFADYEGEWFSDGALIQIQMFANGYPGSYWEEKEQTIQIRVSVNYADAPYFRERDAEDIKQLILTESEFLAMPIADIIKQITI